MPLTAHKQVSLGVVHVWHTVISWCVILALVCLGKSAHARLQRDRPLAASAKQRVEPQPSAHAEDSLTPLRTVGRSTLFSSQLFQVQQAPLGPLGHNTKEAEHKKLWPLNWEDVVGFFVAAVGLFIAAGGELGGGGVLVLGLHPFAWCVLREHVALFPLMHHITFEYINLVQAYVCLSLVCVV